MSGKLGIHQCWDDSEGVCPSTSLRFEHSTRTLLAVPTLGMQRCPESACIWTNPHLDSSRDAGVLIEGDKLKSSSAVSGARGGAFVLTSACLSSFCSWRSFSDASS